MAAKDEAFHQLKPVCVGLSQTALTLRGRDGNVAGVLSGLDQLHKLLKTSKISAALDEKLADYVFYPIFHVLSSLEKLPVHAKELVLECITILLKTAWKSSAPPELGLQLLILLRFLADKDAEKTKTSEELQLLAFNCITLIFVSLGQSQAGKDALTADVNMPHIGETVFTLVEAAKDGSSADIQQAALLGVRAFTAAWPDRTAFAQGFFPGIMSSLTHILENLPSQKRTVKLLTLALQMLTELLPAVLSDSETKGLPQKAPDKSHLDKPWLTATAGQVKLALAKVLKLQAHDRSEVRRALGALCSECLLACWESLSDSKSMLLDTLTGLAARDDQSAQKLKLLIAANDAVAGVLQSSLYHWVVSMPRTVVSSDDVAQQRLISRIAFGYQLLADQNVGISQIDDVLASNLRDSVANVITNSKPSAVTDSGVSASDLQLTTFSKPSSGSFEPVITASGSQKDTVEELSNLVARVSESSRAAGIAQELVPDRQGSNPSSQVSQFWLCLSILRQIYARSDAVDEFLDFDSDSTAEQDLVLQQLYSLSVDHFLTDEGPEPLDWRVQALALETIALQAAQDKEAFRPELIDVLYPIVHRLGSSHKTVQGHAITCLNIIADKCRYMDVQDLILSNVDYLVNAVGLRLHALNPSPQAPMVLVMMVRLAGPSLLPYLDDLVESIFATLESFHGYPRLVDLLFFALKAIAEEGAKNTQLAISDGREGKQLPACQPQSIEKLVEGVRLKRARFEKQSIGDFEQTDQGENEAGEDGFPRHPWKNLKSQQGRRESDEQAEDTTSESHSSSDDTPDEDTTHIQDPPPPAAPTYSLLLKITRLTQHYLGSASLELRISLLGLVQTISPALAQHESSFLPLINTLWPAILPRLQDPESYVVAGTLDAISSMCSNSGDFMRSRIEESWRDIRNVHARCRPAPKGWGEKSDLSRDRSMVQIRADASMPLRSPTSEVVRYQVEAPSRVIWHSLVRLLVTVVRFVAVGDNLFDEIMSMLSPVIERSPEVREALDARNADSVWLLMTRKKEFRPSTSAILEAGMSPRLPASTKAHWIFAAVTT